MEAVQFLGKIDQDHYAVSLLSRVWSEVRQHHNDYIQF